MKTLPLVIGSALGLTALLSPVSVHAEETAPTQQSAPSAPSSADLAAKLLADLLKQSSAAAPDAAAPAAAAPADAQTQELQTLLIGVLKTIAQMLPKFLAALDSTTSSASDSPFNANVEDFLNNAMAPVKKLREEGLRTGGLKTSGLTPDGTAATMSDEDWKRLFQKRESAR